MTLNLLLTPQPSERKTVILADPSTPPWLDADPESVEPVLAGLRSQLDVERVVYPLPHESARSFVTLPSLVRGRHADMWHALSRDERERVILVAGPSAAYLAPVLGDEATTLVLVPDPRKVAATTGAWRSVLGPFPELDEIPESAESEEGSDRWLDLIRGAISDLQLVRATNAADIALEVAEELGLDPAAATSAASAAESAGSGTGELRSRKRPPHWIDEALYSLTRPAGQGPHEGQASPPYEREPAGRVPRRASAKVGRVERTKEKSERRRSPARLSVALAEWMERAEESGDTEGLRRPARLIARLAEWVRSHDGGELERAFRSVDLEVHERKPDHHYVNEYYGRSAKKLRSGLDDEEFFPLAQEVWEQNRTYLYYNRLYTLYQAVRNVARRFPAGELRFLEAGAYKGGSAYFLARVAERYASDRVSLITVDTFEGHSEKDLPTGKEGAHTFNKFKETSVEDVREYLSPFGFVEVEQGRIQDVAPTLEGEMHLIHLDIDIYAPTRFALGVVAERLEPGGIAIIDDYGFTTCPGVKRAVDEFVEVHAERFIVVALDSGQAVLVRTC